MTKRIIALLTLVVMLVSMLAACGGEGSGSSAAVPKIPGYKVPAGGYDGHKHPPDGRCGQDPLSA